MASRLKRTNSLSELLPNVSAAKRLAEKYDTHSANPAEFLTPLDRAEQDTWDNLLSRMK